MNQFYERFKDSDRESLEEYLIWAITDHDMETMKYLLTSPDLREYPNIHAYDGQALKKACAKNSLEMVKFLLTSPDLKEKANIHTSNDYCIKTACKNGYLELFKYLISSPDLKEKISIHTMDDKPFRSAFVSKQFDIIKCMIFDFNIEKNEKINDFLQSFISSKDHELNTFAKEVKDLFEKRDLHKSLNEQLNANSSPIKKAKL